MLNELKQIAIADYDYPLPDDRIARHPMAERDHSKLLMLQGEKMEEHSFFDLPRLLPADAMLVFNDTRVIHARLLFRKPTGSTIEIFCLEPHQMALSEAFEQRARCVWNCLVGNNKRWREATIERELDVNGQACTLVARRLEAAGSSWVVEFAWTGGASFAEVIEQAGVIPLPPYLGREAEADDNTRYQTVYARNEGSVAAPTAGLHFTPTVLHALELKGIPTEYITLHVGAGTFKPVSSPTIGEHEMHAELVELSASNLQHIIENTPKRKIVAVGTTTVRTLESVYWFGCKLLQDATLPSMHIDQWDPYREDLPAPSLQEAYAAVLRWMERQGSSTLRGTTQLMIAPGYRYRVVQALITNFHQPKSTLLLLVSALIGDRWRALYHYALQHDFRFLSYGDSCLLMP